MMVALLAVLACVSPEGDTGTFTFPFSADPCDLDTPEVESPLEDGDALPLHPHEHGGWYFVGGASTYNLEGDATVRQTLRDASGAVVSDLSRELTLRPPDGCESLVSDLVAFVDIWAAAEGSVEALEGAPMTLHVEVSTPHDPPASAEVTVYPVAAER